MAYDGSISFNTEMDTTGFQTGTNTISTLSTKGKVAVTAAITACVTALAKFVQSAIQTGSEFDAAMSQVAATMGVTKDDISELTEKAKEMGSTTAFTATEAAEGLNILAMAGYDATEQCEMIESVLNLAAAGATSMDNAASYLTTTLKGYCVASEDVGEMTQYYSDLMAKGATMVNTSVDELGEAMSRSAATSNAYGQSVETTTVSLLALADGGITGSQAANYLARMMTNLYAPTSAAKSAMDELTETTQINCRAYDEDTGETRDFMEIIMSLKEATADLSEEEANNYIKTIMGQVGLKGYNAIATKTSDQIEEMTANLIDCDGAAEQMADTQLDNLQGDMTLLNSAVDGLKIQLFETLDGPLRGIVQFATNAIIPAISSVLGWVQKGINGIKSLWQEEETEAGNLRNEMDELDDTIGQMNNTFDEARESNTATVDSYRSMADELEKLSSQTNLTSSQQERMNYICQQFQDAGLDIAYDSATNSIEGGTDAIYEFCDAMEGQLEYNTAVDELNELLGERAELERICTDAEIIMSGETEASYGEMYKAGQAYEQAQADLEELNERIDECSEYLDSMGGAISDTSSETSSEFGAMRTEVDNMVKQISELDDAYDEAYDAALESLEGQFDLWEEVGDVVTTSVEDIMAGIQSQEKYYSEYADNMENLTNRQIDGLDELVAAYADGSTESAGYIASMAKMSDEQLEEMIAEMAKVSEQQARVADDAAEASTQYTDTITDMVDDVVDKYDDLDMHDELVEYTENSMGGVVEAIENEEGEIEEAVYSVSDKGAEVVEESLNGMTENVAESMEVATGECAEALEEVVTLSADAEGQISGSVTEMADTIVGLVTSYQDVYDAAYESMSGQFDLWEQAGEVSVTSMEELQSALDSQQAYWEQLADNIELLSNSGIDGMDQLLASVDTTSTEGVAYIASLAAGLGDSSFDMQAYVDQATEGMSGSWEQAATSVANSTASYESSVEEAMQQCIADIEELDQGSEAQQYAIETLQGYLNGLAEDGGEVSEEILEIAQQICDSFADELGTHSPSTVFEEYGEDTTEGYINGLDGMSEEAAAKLEETTSVLQAWGAEATSASESASEGVLNAVSSNFSLLPGTVQTNTDSTTATTTQWCSNMLSSVQSGTSNVVSSVDSSFSQIPSKVQSQMNSALSAVTSWSTNMQSTVSNCCTNLVTNVDSNFQQIATKIQTYTTTASNTINTWCSTILNKIKTCCTSIVSNVSNYFQQVATKIQTFLTTAQNTVNTWCSNVQTAIKNACSNMVSTVSSYFNQMNSTISSSLNSALSTVNSFGSKMTSAGNTLGSNIIQGMINGINSKSSSLYSTISSVVNTAVAKANSAAATGSPSRKTMWTGQMMDEGLAVGLDKYSGMVEDAMDDVMAIVDANNEQNYEAIIPAMMCANEKDVSAMVERMQAAVNSEAGEGFRGFRIAGQHNAEAGIGGNITYDQHVDQTNNYYEPVISPSTVSRNQREALRNYVGGVA